MFNVYSPALPAGLTHFTSLYFRGCLRPRSFAGYYQGNVLILRAIIVNLFSKVGHHAARRQGDCAVGIVLRACAHPPGSRNYGDEPVIGMEVRVAHVMRGPASEDNVH